ncbi:hypothetical protein FRB90_011635 [Tulasnella sp. 427]|nr:hypothetical protein FRB90_011635 [Tulasnella sp. 427]
MKIILQVVPGYTVDMLPFLRYFPEWLPGMGFKRDGALWRAQVDEIKQSTFDAVKTDLASPDAGSKSSFMANNLRDLYKNRGGSKENEELDEDEQAISNSGFSFFTAGMETTQVSLHALFLAMVLWPKVQEKLQDEIDTVVGAARLPSFDDQSDMPYLHAVLLETLRWNPAVPMALPHSSIKDDTWDQHFIPKGTIVIGNAWGISRNTQYYADPSTFNPERFLKPDPELDPRKFVFGFGRRVCPGDQLAFQALWINATSTLWAFKLKGIDLDTEVLHDDAKRFNFGTSNVPAPFKCDFTPRQEGLEKKLSLL